MKLVALVAAFAAGIPGIALAQDANADAAPAPEKKICRTERATGSLTRRTRICLTRTEWRDLNNRTRKGIEEMGQNAAGGANNAWQPSNGPAAGAGG